MPYKSIVKQRQAARESARRRRAAKRAERAKASPPTPLPTDPAGALAEWSRTNIVYTGVGGKGRVVGFVVKPSPEPLARHGRFMCSYKDDRFDRRFRQEDLNDYLAAGHTCLAFSDDGVAWRPYEGNPLCPCLDTIQDLHWDDRLGLYVLLLSPIFQNGEYGVGHLHRRGVSLHHAPSAV